MTFQKSPNNRNGHIFVYLSIIGDKMKVRNYFKIALEQTQEKLDNFIFKCNYRYNSKHFSRESKMGFKETILFMMNMVKKSLQLELNSFFETVLKKDFSVSKQAYSKARQNIKPELFLDLSDSVINGFYGECDDYKVWNGYRLSAIDSTVLEIPNTELLRQEFGYIKNQYEEVARARAVCIFDVQNKLIIKSKIDRFDVSEINIAHQLINQMISDGIKKELILFDRGFPSAELVSLLIDNEIGFVMRTKKNFSKAVVKATKKDQIIKMKYKKKLYDVRVLRFPLQSGEEEILLTSLLDKKLNVENFKTLYFMRWGIETKFNDLKNKLQIENFTGTTKISIEQDFYASIYLSNMIELARLQNEEMLQEQQRYKDLKYEYKPNLNMLIGTLKDKFIIMLLEKSRRKRNKMFKEIMDQVAQNSIPIRPDRQNPRKKTPIRGKYMLNKKRCL